MAVVPSWRTRTMETQIESEFEIDAFLKGERVWDAIFISFLSLPPQLNGAVQ